MLHFKYLDRDGKIKSEAEIASPVDGDKAILDLLDDAKMKLPYGCRSGGCGVCRLRVLSGAEMLEPKSYVEEDTLDRCGDLDDVRLGCSAKVKAGSIGEIVLEKAPEIK